MNDGFKRITHLAEVRKSHHKYFTGGYLNINSLRYKIESIRDIPNRNYLDFLCIAETKLDGWFPEASFKANNCRPYRKDHKHTTSGGLCLIWNTKPKAKNLETDKLESLCIEVRLGKTKWLIAICYKNADIKNNDFETFMSPFLNGIIAAYDRFILMGDLNCDMHSTGNSLSHVSDLFDLHNLIDEPTCFKVPAGTLLDVILIPSPRSISTHEVIEAGLSDWHGLVLMVTKMHAPKVMSKISHTDHSKHLTKTNICKIYKKSHSMLLKYLLI